MPEPRKKPLPKKSEDQPEPPKVRPLAFKIVKPAANKYLKAIIYGDYGTGKTTLAATAQDVKGMGDVIFADVEAGTMSIANRDDIDVVTVTKYRTFARFHDFLRTHCYLREKKDVDGLKELEAKWKCIEPSEIKKPKIYRTVVIDSLTEVQKLCMYQLLGIMPETVKLDAEVSQPEFAEWGKSAEMIRLLIRSFRNLPMNVIFICSQIETQDEVNRISYKPALPGKLAKEAQGFVDVVGRLIASAPDKEGVLRRRLKLQPSTKHDAKDRYHRGNTIAYIDDPTLGKFMSIKPDTGD